MRDDDATPIGGSGKIVEADETYFGKRKVRIPSKQRGNRPYTKSGKAADKRPIVALVERGGSVRSFHIGHATKHTVGQIVRENIDRESRLHTDESKFYTEIGEQFAGHETVKHSAKEYVRGDVHTNTIEGYFSIFKRGMKGVYQHCSEKHLHRYLAEFDFRYNNRIALGIGDTERASRIVRGAEGKRLTYRRPDGLAL
jgi:transposase-like protein